MKTSHGPHRGGSSPREDGWARFALQAARLTPKKKARTRIVADSKLAVSNTCCAERVTEPSCTEIVAFPTREPLNLKSNENLQHKRLA